MLRGGWKIRVSPPRALRSVDQPVLAEGRAVTFWHELPPHKNGTVADVANVLREFHRLAPPTGFRLPLLAPFVRLTERIDAAHTLTDDDRAWLRARLGDLRRQYAELLPGLPTSVVHGDAWEGNVVATSDGLVLLDFERCAIGPPEWDLLQAAIDYSSCGWMSRGEYRAFVHSYGIDVLSSPRFPILRDIRELRMTLFAAQLAVEHPDIALQAALRLACLRGEQGSRPWSGWREVP